MFKKLISILMCVFIFSGCTFKKEIPIDSKEIFLSDEQEKQVGFETIEAQKIIMDIKITVPAEFKAINRLSSKIFMPIDGKIQDVFVEDGQSVKNGQVLASIHSDQLAEIQGEVLENMLEIETAKNSYEREKKLLERHVTSVADFESSKKEYQQAQARLSIAKQRLAIYGADTSGLKAGKIRPYTTIRANKDGIILSRSANAGEFSFTNDVLFEIADLSKIWIVGHVFDKDILRVKVGDKVTANTEGLYKTDGVITFVSSSVNPETKALEIRAEIDNKDGIIKSNTYAQMSIAVDKKETLAVPKEALQKYGEANIVFVKLAPNHYSECFVEIGDSNDKFVEIKTGLKEGDIVVTKGSFYILGEQVKKIEGIGK